MKFFKNGFTLAEVLITLTIIGVVAATTLPSLNSNVSNRALETQVKKLHNTLTNAVASYLTEQGAEGLEDINSFDPDTFVTQYLKPISKCQTPTAEGCMQSTYKYGTNNYTWTPYYNNCKAYILNDGNVVCFFTLTNGSNPYIQVYADTNGVKGPNKEGYDMFELVIRNDGSIDDYITGSSSKSSVLSRTQATSLSSCKSGGYCYGYLVRNGFKIDY